MNSEPPTAPRPASLFRRLAALVYDGLLLVAILLVATGAAVLITRGRAIGAHNPLFTTYLFVVSFLFFAWFWLHGGQTAGMRAWRIRLQRPDGKPLTVWHALLRFLSALPAWILLTIAGIKAWAPDEVMLSGVPAWPFLAVGVALLLADNGRFSWRDKFSLTQVVEVPKKQ